MDAYQQQHHHRFMRPPQPPLSTTDPYSYHHHHHPQQQRPPLPPQPTWYPNQYQYHQPPPPPPPGPSSHSSPLPPPQWAPPPPPHSDYLTPPPVHPYPAHHPYPPPPPRPHAPSQPSQSYPQERSNPNWSHQQSWDYSVQNNEDDWASRARAWADGNNVAVNDQTTPQSQFTQVRRAEEPTGHFEQYPQQAVDPYYHDIQQHPFSTSVYQQQYQQPMAYSQESVPFRPGQSSNVPDGRFLYPDGSGISAGAPTTSPSVHQQEVPSSYSSVTGKGEAADHKEQLRESLSLPTSTALAQEAPQHLPAYVNQVADPTTDLSNQPLNFTPGFNCDHNPHMQSSYTAHHDSSITVRSMSAAPSTHSWSPAISTGASYPPIPSVLPLGPQHDQWESSIAIPPPGHNALHFGGFPGSSLQPTIMPSGAPYSAVAGAAIHPTSVFPGDSYGVSTVSERPRKASVPNWLKEEIIKNAPVMARPSLELPKEETQSIEDEDVDKPFEKDDRADSKSIDSSRSTEEEEDDEDHEEAARSAAINQEIKRLLTEVLLQVTDELFDEIATKVISEEDLAVKVCTDVTSNDDVSTYPMALPAPKASTRLLVPVKTKEWGAEDVTEKFSSSSPGNVLGLVNYDSDEEDDDYDETRNSSMSSFRKGVDTQQLNSPTSSKAVLHKPENGPSQELGKNIQEMKLGNDLSRTSPIHSNNKNSTAIHELSELGARVVSGKTLESNNGSRVEGATVENFSVENPITHFSQNRETSVEPYLDNQHDSKRSYSGKDLVKEAENGSRADEKRGDHHRRQDEKHPRKKTDDHNDSKERRTERSDRTGVKPKEMESRKRPDVKGDRIGAAKSHRVHAKEDSKKKRERSKDKEEDKARHSSSKHKRRRSSSTSSGGKDNKNDDSSDEASYDSKRKLYSRKQNLSPSPVRSRRRQVSRSPLHSKHSQRRHSPYSSLETTRGRRSRSKSPSRRRR